MRLEVYRTTNPAVLPGQLLVALDGVDDRFLAAFVNYPDSVKMVVAAWGTTGEIAGEPIAALIVTVDRIVTGYIDLLDGLDPASGSDDALADKDMEGDGGADFVDHQEPSRVKRLAALLARLRRVSRATWLLAHDADTAEPWIEQGFVVIDPPPNIPTDEAVLVLAWGKLPADADTLLRVRGLSWHRDRHRGFVKDEF